ncbi:MAG: RNA methyltransferase PUA domain-containing protein, partial [Bradymonadaceae bacterium]
MRRALVPKDWFKDLSMTTGPATLPNEVAHYLRNVLRLKPGDEVELFDGDGRYVRARIDSSVPFGAAEVMVLEAGESDHGESPCEITLLQAIPKG